MAEFNKMESFKIGDARRPQVSSVAQRKNNGGQKEEAKSSGFERIEKLLEAEDSAAQIKALEASMEALKKLSSEAVSPREKDAAAKALVAYEHTMGLIRFLLQTKEEMIAAK